MLNRGSGLGPLAAAFIKRAATDWRVVLWLVGGVSLLILPAWFAAFRETPPSRLRVHSATPSTPTPVRSPALKTDLSGPPVIPEVFARLNPARAAARSAPALPGRPDRGIRSAEAEAASASAPGPFAARQGGELEAPSRTPKFTDALPSRLSSSVRTEAAAAGVPLTPFSQAGRAAPPQTEERARSAAAPAAKASARAGGALGAGAGPAPSAGQATASVPAGPDQAAGAAAAPGSIASGSAGSAGSPAAGGLSASGLESIAAPSRAAAASALAMGGAAAVDASGMAQASIAASAKCAETSSYWTPIIQKASQEMLALNNQAIACGPTIKCSLASHQYCTEPDTVPLWWKSYYESRCACARKHCAVRDKCEEVNSLNCQQLHACPITATKPCTRSPCDY